MRSRKEYRWLGQDGADWVLKLTERQIEILKLTIKQKGRFSIADLAREIELPRQTFADCLKLLETRGLVQVERVAPERDRAFTAKPGPILEAVATVPLSKVPLESRQ